METYILNKIFSIIFFYLKKFIAKVYTFFTTNDYNYVDIQRCNEKNYLIYLKKLSWLDSLSVKIESNDKNKPFINFRRFSVHDIRFNNLVEMELPEGLNDYSIFIKYELKLLGPKKNYECKERIHSQNYGTDGIRMLRYKIIER